MVVYLMLPFYVWYLLISNERPWLEKRFRTDFQNFWPWEELDYESSLYLEFALNSQQGKWLRSVWYTRDKFGCSLGQGRSLHMLLMCFYSVNGRYLYDRPSKERPAITKAERSNNFTNVNSSHISNSWFRLSQSALRFITFFNCNSG